ncbi:MAG: ABC transporter substrate-binding protein [Rhodospirillaceae bacterium]|nr:ABC transporter substrate-binding protein [Rhodospirillaceae bacterium]
MMRWVAALALGVVTFAWSGGESHAKTVRVAVPPVIRNFAQPFQRSGNPSVRFSVYDTLTREDSTGRLGPSLATSWKLESPTLWRFELRPDVTFHNGVPLTARVVADSLAVLTTTKDATHDLAPEVASIERLEVVDATTLLIHTRVPDLILPRRLALIRIVEPVAWAAMGATEYAKAPVGTGPYRVTSWGDGAGLTTLAAVPKSWRGSGEITQLEIRDVPDATARVQALLSGKVDLAFSIAPEDIATLKAAGQDAEIFPAPMVMGLTLRNMADSHPALRDARVRRALNHAVDKQAISREIMAGALPAARAAFTEGVTGYSEGLTAYDFDPDRARRLLAEAGYPDGFTITAGVVSGQVPSDSLLFQAVAQDLRRVGVTLELRSLTFPDFIERLNTARWQDFDAFSLLWGAATYADASRNLDRHSCRSPAPYFCEPSVMPLLEAVSAAVDPGEREQRLKAAVARTHELAPAIWLVQHASIVGRAANLRGLDLAFEGVYFERLSWTDNGQ